MRCLHTVLSFAFAGSVAASLVPAAPVSAAFDMGQCEGIVRAFGSAKSYRAVMTSTFSGKSNATTVEMEKPDRVQVTSPQNEMIAIGKKTWMKMNGGPWKALPGMSGMGDLASMDPSKSFKPTGTGACVAAGLGLYKGQPARLFKTTATSPNLGTVHNTIYVLSDGFVHHVDGDSPHGKMSMDFSDFNSVNISPPN
jgi:hypothetical protein